MSTNRIVAVLMIALGIVVLAYSGLSFRTRGNPVDIGPIHVETTQRHFIPPVVGALVLAGGIALLALGGKKG